MTDKKLRQLADAVLLTSYTPIPAPKNYADIVRNDKEVKQMINKHQNIRADLFSYIKRCERNLNGIEPVDYDRIERAVEHLRSLSFTIKKCINLKYALRNNMLVKRNESERNVIGNLTAVLSFPNATAVWL